MASCAGAAAAALFTIRSYRQQCRLSFHREQNFLLNIKLHAVIINML